MLFVLAEFTMYSHFAFSLTQPSKMDFYFDHVNDALKMMIHI